MHNLSQFVSICLNFAWFRWLISNFLKCKPLSLKWFIWFFSSSFPQFWVNCIQVFSILFGICFFSLGPQLRKTIIGFLAQCKCFQSCSLYSESPSAYYLLNATLLQISVLPESFDGVVKVLPLMNWTFTQNFHKTFTTPLKVSCKHATNLRRTFIKIVPLLQKKWTKIHPKQIKNPAQHDWKTKTYPHDPRNNVM